jgi:hypothetical protein
MSFGSGGGFGGGFGSQNNNQSTGFGGFGSGNNNNTSSGKFVVFLFNGLVGLPSRFGRQCAQNEKRRAMSEHHL